MASKCPYTDYLIKREGTLFIHGEIKIIFCSNLYRLSRVSSAI